MNALIRQLPGCLNVSALVSNQAESEVLVIIFFTSLEAAIDAKGSPLGTFLFDLLERMSKRSRNLGLSRFLFSLEKAQMTAPLNSLRQLPVTSHREAM